MGSWREDSSQTSKMGEKQDDEETWELFLVLERNPTKNRG